VGWAFSRVLNLGIASKVAVQHSPPQWPKPCSILLCSHLGRKSATHRKSLIQIDHNCAQFCSWRVYRECPWLVVGWPPAPEERERDGHWRRAPPSRLLPRMSQSAREGSQPDVCAAIGFKDFQGATTSAAWPGSLCKLCSPRSAGSQRSARRGALDLLTRRRCLTQPGRGSRHLACTLMAQDGRARDRSACRAKDQHRRPGQPRETDAIQLYQVWTQGGCTATPKYGRPGGQSRV